MPIEFKVQCIQVYLWIVMGLDLWNKLLFQFCILFELSQKNSVQSERYNQNSDLLKWELLTNTFIIIKIQIKLLTYNIYYY